MEFQPTIVAPSSEVAVTVPSGVSHCEEGDAPTLVTGVDRALRYSWAMSENRVSDSPVFSVRLYCSSL